MGKQKALRRKLESASMRRRALLKFSKCSPNEIAQNLKASASTDFLDSAEWKALRQSVLDKYGEVCMCCKREKRGRMQINVDHIKPRKFFPELSLDFDNLQVLCGRCNKDKGNKHMTDWRPKETIENLWSDPATLP